MKYRSQIVDIDNCIIFCNVCHKNILDLDSPTEFGEVSNRSFKEIEYDQGKFLNVCVLCNDKRRKNKLDIYWQHHKWNDRSILTDESKRSTTVMLVPSN